MLKKIYFIIYFVIMALACTNYDKWPPDQLTAKGRQLYEEGHAEDAIKLFKKAIEMKPNSADLHFELGSMYFRASQKSYDEALQRSLAADMSGERHKQDPDNDKEMMRYGYRLDLYTAALSEYNEALKYDPDNWKARYFIGTNYLNHKRYNEAIAEFKKIIELAPNFSYGFAFLGQAYSRTGQDQLAIQMLTRAVKLEPDAENYYQLGMAYKRNQNWRKVDEIAHKLKPMDEMRYKALKNPSNYNW